VLSQVRQRRAERGHRRFGVRWDEELTAVVLDAGGDDRLGFAGGELLLLAESPETGALKAGHGRGLAVVDLSVAESLGDEVEVVEDGGLVLDPDEGGERAGSGAAALELAAVVMLKAKLAAVPGRGGAAGAVHFDVAAAGERGGFHVEVL
jgi:hypothetical protein